MGFIQRSRCANINFQATSLVMCQLNKTAQVRSFSGSVSRNSGRLFARLGAAVFIRVGSKYESLK
jgi:hypothetical protein